jgi:prepilin-type N-terminal cleavage/methylation domain-containing protein
LMDFAAEQTADCRSMKIKRNEAYRRKMNAFRKNADFLGQAQTADPSALKADATAPQNRFEAGFTLAEIMVGSALLAVMVVALYGGVSFGFASISLARQNLRATQVALEKMEITRMYSWDQVNSNGFVPATFTAPFFPGSGTNLDSGLTYYGTMIITNVNTSTAYSNDMRELRVTLNWTNKNIPQTLQMSTYISQYGMQRYIY